jgi:signal transduction histidine kinase
MIARKPPNQNINMKSAIHIKQAPRWRFAHAEADTRPTARASRLHEAVRPRWEVWPEQFRVVAEHPGKIQIAFGDARAKPDRSRGRHPPSRTAFDFERGHEQLLPQPEASRFSQGGGLPCGLAPSLETSPRFAVQAERSRLAREIHDTLVQEFAGILLYLEAASGSDAGDRCTVTECLARARELAKSGLEDARRMLLGMRPRALEDITFSDALRQLADRFSHDCNITCKFRLIGRGRDLPLEAQDELYRVAQEALCNARKHSRATAVSLSLGYRPGVVELTIKDNGRGFATGKHRAGWRGYGLGTMRERTHRLGGRIRIKTVPGAGTAIRIAVPLHGEE